MDKQENAKPSAEEQDKLAVTVGKNLTRLRKMANMTQLDLAEKLNYSDKSVSKWEQGNGIPDIRILVQLSELLGVSLDDLVREQPEKVIMPKRARLVRRLIVLACSVGLCWLVAVVGFVLCGIFAPQLTGAWLAFLYAVPASAIVVVVFSSIWRYKWTRFISVSVLIWTVLACCYCTVTVVSWYHSTMWLIFLIGVPLQLLAFFFFAWWKRLRSYKP